MSEILVAGTPPEPPKKKVQPDLWIVFHPETQSVEVVLHAERLKSWDFARALLLMGAQQAERMADMQAAQKFHQAMQDNAMVQGIMKDLPRR
jgi:hypothetical protein